jgi:hypothetical protein
MHHLDTGEAYTYSGWYTLLSLLKLGIPWDAIHALSPQEVELILTIETLRNEREAAALKATR